MNPGQIAEIPIAREPSPEMKSCEFVDGIDRRTFFPFILQDRRASTGLLILIFADWEWLDKAIGGDSFEDYYLNGYGVEGILQAARLRAGLSTRGTAAVEYSSEGDTCLLRFDSLEEACRTAELAQAAFGDVANLRSLVALARENGFGE